MSKAKEISALYKDIKQQMGKLVSLCHDVEDHAEATEAHAEVTADAYQRGYKAGREAEKVRQPDLEQVRKEAYQKGYETGYEDGYSEPGKNQQEAYQRGLNDAWEAARKICTNWVLPDSVLSEIFGMGKTIDDIMKENTASEAIEKIRQYEQEKDRQARIEYNFDEIKDVLETTAKECNVSLDEIAEVLAKMKEADNG